MSDTTPDPRGPVFYWLLAVYGMIAAMVLIGGVTRLTGSGLSMVTWRPLMGALPPLGEADWQAVFEQYQQFPQYQRVNDWMTLADFKRIFFWEYLHRLFGRLIGVVFFIPWLWLILRKRLRGRWAARSFIAFVLGGLQGVLGWYMVKSGLVDIPAVSHFRLAAHLGLAFFVGGYVWWMLLDLRPGEGSRTAPFGRRWGWAFLGLLVLQIVYGAFVAGTRAGFMYQTFPDMNGVMVPADWLSLEPAWRNFVANHDTINFVHRSLGWVVGFTGLALGVVSARRAETARQRLTAYAVAGCVLLQFALGVAAVVMAIPTALGAAHQLGAFVLLSAALAWLHAHRPPPQTAAMASP